MTDRPVTVICPTPFLRAADRIMDADEVDRLIDYLACNPLAGTVIEGSGGVRKLRWRLAGRGKRGGARVIYFYRDQDLPLLMLTVYAKAAADDLTPGDLQRIAKAAAEYVRTYRRRS